IGKAIDTRGRKAEEVTREVETWIEAEMGRLEHGAA
ncbi:MAG: 1-acyl-sn-glycerol-3-phosphate acyltransferase, partial [Betaproteobacteria bacterium]